MAVEWTKAERTQVDEAMRRYPVASGLCAALARAVYRTGTERDSTTRARQVRPPKNSAARYVVPKLNEPPRWVSHTFVETHAHAVDALTGPDGCARESYVETHWEYADHLEIHDVDVESVDPGIQDEP